MVEHNTKLEEKLIEIRNNVKAKAEEYNDLVLTVLAEDIDWIIKQKEWEETSEEEKEKSYEMGHFDGHSEGYDEGYSDGHSEGYDEGYEAGYDAGHEESGDSL